MCPYACDGKAVYPQDGGGGRGRGHRDPCRPRSHDRDRDDHGGRGLQDVPFHPPYPPHAHPYASFHPHGRYGDRQDRHGELRGDCACRPCASYLRCACRRSLKIDNIFEGNALIFCR